MLHRVNERKYMILLVMFIYCIITIQFNYSDELRPDCHYTPSEIGQTFGTIMVIL